MTQATLKKFYRGEKMIDLIKEKGQILMILTYNRHTQKGGIMKYYKMYVSNKENTFLYDIGHIMKNMGFKTNKQYEILMEFAGSHKAMVRDKLKQYLDKDIQIITNF